MYNNIMKNKHNINPNKQAKCKDKLEDLLNKNRISGSNTQGITHITLNPTFQGKYTFNKEERKKLNKLVKESNKLGVNLGVAEKPKEFGPIMVDIDLELEKDDYEKSDKFKKNKRLYDNDLILKSIDLYRESIKKFLDVNDTELQVCVLEKDHMTEKENSYKDGVHLIFPQICAHFKVRHLIRNEVVTQAKNITIFTKYSKSIEDIFDKSIVSSNFWIMYGNSKHKCPPYKLTQLIAYDDSELDIEDLTQESDSEKSQEKLVKLFSLQSSVWTKDQETPLSCDYTKNDIEEKCFENGVDNSNISNFEILPMNKEDEFRKAKYLVSLLSTERANNYHDWIKVGWSLHNIDISLLPIWLEFSGKCPGKYNEKDCRHRWQGMKPGLTIRSLQAWAKEDNYHEYNRFMKDEFEELLKKSLQGDTYTVAKALYTKYYERFVCASIKHNSWYEFRNHRWHPVDGGYSLMKIISEEFVNEYLKVSCEYNTRAITATGLEKEDLQKKGSRFQKIVDKLLNLGFKKNIMDECKYLFHDENFQDKLDENHFLLGCENGVYDLEKSEFRPGRPDDFITLTTKNSYYGWDPRKPQSKNILQFFSKILPNDDVRNYFVQALCTCLSGENREEKLYIPTGGGSNGKSLTFELVNLAMGEYYISCPITIMTRKRGASGQASPELARIKGKRVGVLQEPDNTETLNVGLMKELTGNDAFMARGLFEDPREIKPQIKFFLTCNDLPMVPSRDGGTWRRLRVVNFGSKFINEPVADNEFKIDTRLKEKIKEWGPYFLAYLIHIYNSVYKKSSYLVAPEAIIASTNSYQADNDYFLDYFDTRIEMNDDPKSIISKTAAVADFKAWFKQVHEGNKLPRNDLLGKFLDEQLGKQSTKGWKKVAFRNDIVDSTNDEEEEKNDLDI
jgi:P4 family phage/plasmid primase-like protien